jgi:hypothetical protein
MTRILARNLGVALIHAREASEDDAMSFETLEAFCVSL